MRKVFLLLCLFLFSIDSFAASELGVTSQFPSDARYEIIQSPLAGKYQFRLDKQTGKTWVLQYDANNDEIWTETIIYGLPVATTTKIHFQIVMSGLTAKYMLLLDTDNGKTWVAYNSASGNGVTWYPMPNP
jgi:hypothetical protein